jgi:hypothetical protein
MKLYGGIATTAPSTAIQKGCHGSRPAAFPFSPKTDRAAFGWGFCDSEKAKPKSLASVEHRSSVSAAAMMRLRAESAHFIWTAKNGSG